MVVVGPLKTGLAVVGGVVHWEIITGACSLKSMHYFIASSLSPNCVKAKASVVYEISN